MLRIVFYAPIMGVGGIIKALGQDASMSWIIAAAVMALLAMIGVVFVIAIPKFRIIQKHVDKLNLVTREMLTGLMVVRAFNTQKFEEDKFEKANVDLTKTTLFINRIMVFMMPAMMLLMNGVMLLIVWVGAHQIDAGCDAGGKYDGLHAVLHTDHHVLPHGFHRVRDDAASGGFSPAYRRSSGNRVQHQRSGKTGEIRRRTSKGWWSFRMWDLNIPAPMIMYCRESLSPPMPGQTTAIVGGTGSGKSTLINLIPRFYDVTEGKILVNNTDIREVTQHDLRDKIGYIPQKASLFSGTIESNIAYGNDSLQRWGSEKSGRNCPADGLYCHQRKRFSDTGIPGRQPTSPADKNKGFPLPGHWPKNRRSISSMIVSRPSILRPMPL